MSSSPVETEIKLRVPSADRARALFAQHGFEVRKARVFEANLIYDTPAREIRGRGELLRLRRVGDDTVLTFKGVGAPGKHKSRPETETRVHSFAAMDAILRQLGYVVLFRYEKYRTEYERRGEAGTATLDETPIGVFLELEGEAGWIDGTAKELGFQEAEYVTDSYGRLFEKYCNDAGVPVTNMVFEAGGGDHTSQL